MPKALKRGPVTFDQLIKLLSQLPTPRRVLVWREGFTDWIAAENVREIASAIPPPAPKSSEPFVDRAQQQFTRGVKYSKPTGKEVVEAILSILTIPLMLLHMLGGIVSGIGSPS